MRCIAAPAGNGSAKHYEADGLHEIAVQQTNSHINIVPATAQQVAMFYIASRTGQQVKHAAVAQPTSYWTTPPRLHSMTFCRMWAIG